MTQHFKTIAAPSIGIFKDRGSVFHGYAFPVSDEEAALAYLAELKKEHFKARHHCFAWRIGTEGTQFRANDDGEPSGTAGRPILGQIDKLELTNVFVVVVRYFGGTLLGASGLIRAYRAAAEDALQQAEIIEKTIESLYRFTFTYALMPNFMQAVKSMNLHIHKEEYGHEGMMEIGIPCTETEAVLTELRAAVLNVSREEAAESDFPEGILTTALGLAVV